MTPIGGADALALVPGLAGPLAELITGAAGSSPYLADLCRREGAWLAEALSDAPETAFEALLVAPVADVMVDLRRMKARAAALIAFADLAGVWSLEEVTRALTRLADHAVRRQCAMPSARSCRVANWPGQGDG